MILFSPKKFIGIDLDDGLYKIIELRKYAKGFRIENAIISKYPNFDYYQKATCVIAAALPDNLTLNKTILLDNALSDREIESYLHANIEKLVNLPATAIYFDFVKTSITNKPKANIHITVARRQNVDEKIKQFAPLKITNVDVESQAIIRAIKYTNNHLLNNAVIIIHNKTSSCLLITVINRDCINYKEIPKINTIEQQIAIIKEEIQLTQTLHQQPIAHLIITGNDINRHIEHFKQQIPIPITLINPLQECLFNEAPRSKLRGVFAEFRRSRRQPASVQKLRHGSPSPSSPLQAARYSAKTNKKLSQSYIANVSNKLLISFGLALGLTHNG
jgi:Tfp pilus assembly PilM family ATPase